MTSAKPSGGNTPLSPEELADLIPSLAAKEELNEWERDNILLARRWAMADRASPHTIVSDQYVRRLHREMFSQTWKWAGQYRRTEKNLGIPFHQIHERLAALFGDVRDWMENGIYPADETAIRFHHRLVAIHPFPNGNGRHGRLIADVLVKQLGRPVFSWGAAELVHQGEFRLWYLDALKAADLGDIRPLLEFARS